MQALPQARKDAILSKMLSPYPPTIRELSRNEGISEATLYNWRKQLRREGRPVPKHDRTSDNWYARINRITSASWMRLFIRSFRMSWLTRSKNFSKSTSTTIRTLTERALARSVPRHVLVVRGGIRSCVR